MVSFFTCTRLNRSRVGAIDKSDRTKQAFDTYDIPEDPEKIFTNDFWIVGHEKMIIFGVFDDFIINLLTMTFTEGKLRYLRGRSKPFVFSYDLDFVEIFVKIQSFPHSLLSKSRS